METKQEQTHVIAQTIFPYGPMPPSVHYLIEFMVGRKMHLDEAARWQPECAAELTRQHPDLAQPQWARTTDDPVQWIDALAERFGPNLQVRRLP